MKNNSILLRKILHISSIFLFLTNSTQWACLGNLDDEPEIQSNQQEPQPMAQPMAPHNLSSPSPSPSTKHEIDEITPSGKTDRTQFKGHVEIGKDKVLRVKTIVPYIEETIHSIRAAGSPTNSTPTPSSADQNLNIQGNLNVLGKTTLSKNTTIANGPFTVGANKMVVDSTTGNTTIQGKTTINNDVSITSGSLMIKDGALALSTSTPTKLFFKVDPNTLQYSGNQIVFNNSTNQNSSYLSINNQTGQIEMYSAGITHFMGQKALSSIDGTQPVLTLSFSSLLEEMPLTAKGAHVKIKCFISGLVDNSQTETFYEGSFYLLPGAFQDDPCVIKLITEGSIGSLGTQVTIASDVNGTGAIANITLTSSQVIAQQTTTMLYEVTSNNLVEIS